VLQSESQAGHATVWVALSPGQTRA